MKHHRPKTRGELAECLRKGTVCEVATHVVEFTIIALDFWLDMPDYERKPSENDGWTLFIPKKTS